MQIKWVGLLNIKNRQIIQIDKNNYTKVKKEQKKVSTEIYFNEYWLEEMDQLRHHQREVVNHKASRSSFFNTVKEPFLATVKEVHSLAWYSFTEPMDSEYCSG